MIGPPNDEGCREWQGPVYRNQTPSLTIKGHQFTIPRLIYDVWRAGQGLDPVPNGIKVTKKNCRNRMCCNPEHMGTAVRLPGEVDEWKAVIEAAGTIPLHAQLETAIFKPVLDASDVHWDWIGPRQGNKPVWYSYEPDGRRLTIDACQAYFALHTDQNETSIQRIRHTCGQSGCMKPDHMATVGSSAEESAAQSKAEIENRLTIQAALTRKAEAAAARAAKAEATRLHGEELLQQFMESVGGTYTPAETSLDSAVSANQAHSQAEQEEVLRKWTEPAAG